MMNNSLTTIMSQTAGAAFFTVNNAVDEVSLEYPVNDYGLMISGDDKTFIEMGNNVNFLSMGIAMPLGFDINPMSDDTFFYQKVIFSWKPEFDIKLYYYTYIMPYTNYEMNINTFLNFGTGNPNRYQFFATFDLDHPPKISMIGVPDKFNGKKLFVPIFIKIQTSQALGQAVLI